MISLPTLVTRRSLAFGQTLSRQYADGAMNSLVIITRPVVAFYDETTREYAMPAVTTIYDDTNELGGWTGLGAKAGITVAGGPITMNMGDEPTYYSSATVYIPQSAPNAPRIDDLVLVMASPDTDMVGRNMRIIDVPVGGRISTSTALSCIGIAPSRQWDAS
jgi:hypothetical protein